MGKTTNDNVIKVAIVESADYYGFALLDVAALLVENDEFVIPCLISPEEAISKLRDIRTELDSSIKCLEMDLKAIKEDKPCKN